MPSVSKNLKKLQNFVNNKNVRLKKRRDWHNKKNMSSKTAGQVSIDFSSTRPRSLLLILR